MRFVPNAFSSQGRGMLTIEFPVVACCAKDSAHECKWATEEGCEEGCADSDCEINKEFNRKIKQLFELSDSGALFNLSV